MELKSQAIEMKTVEVVTTRRTETESAVVMETRQSEQVVNGMGREQISKGQDRTAGDVVKRIPGVTMVGDRFVMIRGLADRYNTVMLNDVIAPSLEPDKRAFSFDILPSGALDRVMVYKTGAPELPGEFAGGVIKLYTVNVPSENQTRIDYSTSFRQAPPSIRILQQPTSSRPTHWVSTTVFVNCHRVFQPTCANRTAERVDSRWPLACRTTGPLNKAMLLPTNALSFAAGAAFRKGRRIGDRWQHHQHELQQHTLRAIDAKNYNYNVFDPAARTKRQHLQLHDNENIHQVRISALSNFSLLVGTRTKLEFRNLFTQQGTDQTTLRTGRNFEEQFEVKNYAFRYQQRTIYSGQLHGEHELKRDVNKLSWTGGYGLAISKEPDFRRVRTVRDINTTDADTPFQMIIPPGATTLDAGRFFSDMNENVITGKVDYEHKLTGAKQQLKLRVGAMREMKDRTFDARWMSFKAASSAQFDQSLPLRCRWTRSSAQRTSTLPMVSSWRKAPTQATGTRLPTPCSPAMWARPCNLATNTVISAGVRAEHNTQELKSATFGGARVLVNNPVLSILPSINVSRSLTERSTAAPGLGHHREPPGVPRVGALRLLRLQLQQRAARKRQPEDRHDPERRCALRVLSERCRNDQLRCVLQALHQPDRNVLPARRR